jgi:hypothetical protein
MLPLVNVLVQLAKKKAQLPLLTVIECQGYYVIFQYRCRLCIGHVFSCSLNFKVLVRVMSYFLLVK